MDISKASNFERFVFDFMGRDGKATASMFKQVDKVGGFDISKDAVFKDLGQYGFQSGRSTHANRLRNYSRY
jgi:threonine synthase